MQMYYFARLVDKLIAVFIGFDKLIPLKGLSKLA